MKKTTYRILTLIPIVRQVVKGCVDPIWIYGSLGRESGETQKTLDLYNEYIKTHPNEQLTRQLIKKLWDKERERNR